MLTNRCTQTKLNQCMMRYVTLTSQVQCPKRVFPSQGTNSELLSRTRTITIQSRCRADSIPPHCFCPHAKPWKAPCTVARWRHLIIRKLLRSSNCPFKVESPKLHSCILKHRGISVIGPIPATFRLSSFYLLWCRWQKWLWTLHRLLQLQTKPLRHSPSESSWEACSCCQWPQTTCRTIHLHTCHRKTITWAHFLIKKLDFALLFSVFHSQQVPLSILMFHIWCLCSSDIKRWQSIPPNTGVSNRVPCKSREQTSGLWSSPEQQACMAILKGFLAVWLRYGSRTTNPYLPKHLMFTHFTSFWQSCKDKCWKPNTDNVRLYQAQSKEIHKILTDYYLTSRGDWVASQLYANFDRH